MAIIPARYVLAILGCMAMAIIYGLKVNLSVAIVSMVKKTREKPPERSFLLDDALRSSRNATFNPDSLPMMPRGADECEQVEEPPGETKAGEDGPFEWSKTIQGLLKSAYFWGYLVAQLPGGRIAELVSAKWVMCFAVFINVVCTALSPVAAKLHYSAFMTLRIIEGIGGGVTFPAMHVMLSKWAPPLERGVLSSIVYAGTCLGTVIMTLLTGVIASAWGWESIFYIEGAGCAVWLPLWAFLVSDSPQKQTLISEKERAYIVGALMSEGGEEAKLPVPWKAIFTSKAFYAILIAHTCSNWGWYMVLIELPNYMKNVLNYKIAQNALLSSIPFLTTWVFTLILGKILDTLVAKDKISITAARKTATFIASVIPATCFVVICYIGCQRTLAYALMTVAITAAGGMFCGFLSNHIDIAPNFAGTLMAITNTLATVPGICVPLFVGKLTENDPSINSWRIIFWITIGLYLIEVVCYTLMGSGKEQRWNKP